MRSPRFHVSRGGRALLLAFALSLAPGCASLNPFASGDPMLKELRRLEKEQRRMAHEQRVLSEAEDKERSAHPKTMEDRLRQGDQHLADGNVAAALWEYAAAHKLDPRAAEPRSRLGYVHLRNEPERAQPLFESALELEPDNVSAHIGLGLSLLASRQRDAGLAHLERAVELAPRSAKARQALGVSLDQMGRSSEALVQLEAARDLRPRDSRILNNLGTAHLRAGSPEQAEPLLRAALRQDDRDVELRSNNLGMALALQGRFEEALEAFRKGGDEQSARSNLGYAHYMRGEYREAIDEYELALIAGGKASVQVVRNLEAARHALLAGPPKKVPAGKSEPQLAEDPVAPRQPQTPGLETPDADVAQETAPADGEDPWLWESAPPTDLAN